MTVALFPERHNGRRGLTLFLNAGDPSFHELRTLVVLLDQQGVDCLELAVPFPNVITDGPTIQRSASRAIQNGADLASTLSFVESVKPELSNLKFILMVDWRHTVRALSMQGFLDQVRHAGCDALLLHGVPPRVRPGYYEQAARIGQPIVTSCYVNSSARVIQEASTHASAFVYLMAHYGRGEGAGPPQTAQLAPVIATIRELNTVPVAVGFGVKTSEDVQAVWAAGADAAIVGSACVACVEEAVLAGSDPVERMLAFLTELQGSHVATHDGRMARPWPPVAATAPLEH